MARSRKGPTLRFERQRKGKPIGARRLPSYGIRVPRELSWASPGLAPENATARGIQREGHAPGGKSVYWQANPAGPSRDMPVESFYGWVSEAVVTAGSRHRGRDADSARRRYIRRERYDYRADFFGGFWRSRNLGCCAQSRTRPSRRGVTESRGVCGSLYSRQRFPRPCGLGSRSSWSRAGRRALD